MRLTRLMAAAAPANHRPKTSLLLLSERDVQKCLSIRDCLDVNRKAFIALAQGKAQVPTRIGLPYQSPSVLNAAPGTATPSSSAAAQDWTLFKPAAYYHQCSDNDKRNEEASSIKNDTEHENNDNDIDNDTTLMGIKIVSVRANNPATYQLPLVPATIVSVHAETGLVNAIVAGTYLTAARTAAGSALSAALVFQQKQLLASNSNSNDTNGSRPLFHHLVVFGAGLQAKLHIQAIATAMSDYNNIHSNDDDEQQQRRQQRPIAPIPLVSIINRSKHRAAELKNEILGNSTADSSNHDVQCWAREVQTVLLDDKDAVSKTLSTANVVVTATNTMEPLWQDGDDNSDHENINDNASMMMLPRGCHITGVGSYTPQMREVPLSTARKCMVWMDTPEARFVGDLKDLPDSHPMTLIGHALLQNANICNATIGGLGGGIGEMDYTFFKSVGTAIQDVMTADMVVQRARELNIGQEIDMS